MKKHFYNASFVILFMSMSQAAHGDVFGQAEKEKRTNYNKIQCESDAKEAAAANALKKCNDNCTKSIKKFEIQAGSETVEASNQNGKSGWYCKVSIKANCECYIGTISSDPLTIGDEYPAIFEEATL